MALSTRELYLILRARDEASRVLRSFSSNVRGMSREAVANAQKLMAQGQALATGGVVIAAMGAIALGVMNKMTDAAVAYNEEVAKTYTQVDKAGVSFQQLWNMGMKIGKTVPVAFNQIQASLYDVFSSIDTSGPGAEKILNAIAKASVGGATSMQTTGRALIGVLNGYKLSADKINMVSDIMFQLVRKGVGTYEQFTSTIGRSIPSAIKAGQSFQSLAGMMAFLTRNSLSTAMASASAGRALDALANYKTIAAFREMGDRAKTAIESGFGKATLAKLQAVGVNFKKMTVNMLDSKGAMRPVVDIMADLNKQLAPLTKAEKAAVMQKLLQGSGGTIQAMRFFNHALNDSKGLLKEMTTDMNHAGGAAQQAYNIMANTPAAKIQLMKNRYQEMSITVGQQLIPVKLRLMEILSRILNLWLGLSPHMQNIIVKFAAMAAGAMVILGILLSVVGVFMMLAAAAAMAGTSLLAIVGIAAAVVVGLAEIGVVAYLIYKHWDLVKAKSIETWNSVWAAIKPVINYITHDLVRGFQAFITFMVRQWNRLYAMVKGPIDQVVNAVKDMLAQLMPHLQKFADSFSGAGESFKRIWNGVVAVVRNVVWPMIQFLVGIIVNVLGSAFKFLAPIVVAVFKTIGQVLGAVIDILGAVIRLVIALINGDWSKAWHAALDIVKGIFDLIGALLNGAKRIIFSVIKGVIDGVINFFQHLFDRLVGHSIIPDLVNAIVFWFVGMPAKILGVIASFIGRIISFYASLPGKILSALGRLAGMLFNVWVKANVYMLSAVVTGVGKVISFLAGLPGKAIHVLANMYNAFFNIGKHVMEGLKNGLDSMSNSVLDKISSISKSIVSLPKKLLGISSPSTIFKGIGIDIIQGLIDGVQATRAKALTAMQKLAIEMAAKKRYEVVKNALIVQGKDFVNALNAGLRSGKLSESTIGSKVLSMVKNLNTAATKGIQSGGLSKTLLSENNLLILLTRQRTAVAAKLASANAALAAITKKYIDIKTSVKDSILASFDITQVTGPTDAITQLKAKLQAAKDFVAGIKELLAKGFNKDQVAALAGAGVDSAGAAVKGLLSASSDDVKTFNDLMNQLNGIALSGGGTVAESLYGAGVRAARGLVDGLQKEMPNIQKQMDAIATSMISAIKKALGIKSPSQVFHSLGQMIGRGLIRGMLSTMSDINKTSANLISVTKPNDNPPSVGFGKPGGPPPNYGGGGTTQQFFVYTNEIDPRVHAAQLGWELDNSPT